MRGRREFEFEFALGNPKFLRTGSLVSKARVGGAPGAGGGVKAPRARLQARAKEKCGARDAEEAGGVFVGVGRQY